MRRSYLVTFLLLVSAFVSASTAAAQVNPVDPAPTVPRSFQDRLGISLHASTLGAGGGLHVALLPWMNAHLNASYFGYSQQDVAIDVENETLSLDADAQLLSGALLLDVLPFKKLLRIRAGLLYNANRFAGHMELVDSYTVGAVTFTPEEIGTLSAELDFPPISGYLGLGLGHAVAPGKGFGVLFDLGIVYHQAPRLNMTGTGMIAPTAEQDVDIEENLGGYRWLPVVGLGLSYKPF